MKTKRELAPIAPDPKPTKKDVAAYLRKHRWINKEIRSRMAERMAELEWLHEKSRKEPDLFWWPFRSKGDEDYLKSERWLASAARV
jgi:hypothetical protein